jgi:hypothetical protein
MAPSVKRTKFHNVKEDGVIWDVEPCSLVEVYQRFRSPCCQGDDGGSPRPEDGGSKDPWNVGKFLPDYTAQQRRRQSSSVYCFMANA